MNKIETAEALSLLRIAYPAFYSKITPKEAEAAILLWESIFINDPYEVVLVALKELISKHSGYPPDIAALRHQIDQMKVSAVGEPTDEELWILLKKAASNGYYGYRKEFESLPKILQRYLGVPETLREYAVMEEETFHTVVKGQFLKQIGTIRQRDQFDRETPNEVKQLLKETAQRLPLGKSEITPGNPPHICGA